MANNDSLNRSHDPPGATRGGWRDGCGAKWGVLCTHTYTHAAPVPRRTATAASAEVFVVTDHGAKGAGRTRDDDAIATTFAACRSSAGSAAGPPEVLFPRRGRTSPGRGAACSDSVIVEEGASVAPRQRLDGGWRPGPALPGAVAGLADGLTAFIFAHYARNVTLRQGGTLDAGGKRFWDESCGNWWCASPPTHGRRHPTPPHADDDCSPAGVRSGPGRLAQAAVRLAPLHAAHRPSTDIARRLRFEATAFWCIVPVHPGASRYPTL